MTIFYTLCNMPYFQHVTTLTFLVFTPPGRQRLKRMKLLGGHSSTNLRTRSRSWVSHTMKNKHTPPLLTLIVSFTCVFSDEKPKIYCHEGQAPSHHGGWPLQYKVEGQFSLCGISAHGHGLCYSQCVEKEGEVTSSGTSSGHDSAANLFAKVKRTQNMQKIGKRRFNYITQNLL